MKKMGKEFGDDLGDDFESAVDEAMTEGEGGEGAGRATIARNPSTLPADLNSDPVKTDVHDSLEAVGADAWDSLHAETRLRSPFLAWTWQQQWAAVFAEGRRLEVRCVVDDARRLVALLPLFETAARSLDARRRQRRLRLPRPDRAPRPRGRGVGRAAAAPAPATPPCGSCTPCPAPRRP